ncbi:hypothetical protein GCM10010377_73990 [Streptomyces viridiviolaceus]|uniref:Uncharacterized protein n=1 Tax=Streptomyces viridiviolaceus TaxID=68282 RepID=A0ABW2E182_9ACTN|nr:hypothetical protein [Streptomyces viridiviolaceus]GHB72706.1 hypothetical protein GCM10010377_73990 [Streptomyces viridiviolaceus]
MHERFRDGRPRLGHVEHPGAGKPDAVSADADSPRGDREFLTEPRANLSGDSLPEARCSQSRHTEADGPVRRRRTHGVA